MITASNVVLAVSSGLFGAIAARLLGIWHARKLETERQACVQLLERERQRFEINRTKLSVLRKIAGNRTAATESPVAEHIAPFFEGLNEVMAVFAVSPQVCSALTQYKAAQNTVNATDRLIDLFKAILSRCRY